MSSQENLAKGKGRAWGAARSSTEPFRKKDHATYLGAQRHLGGVGGVAHQQPRTKTTLDVRHEPALCPCGRSACHAPGSHLPASVWLFRPSTRGTVAGDSLALGGSPGGGGADPPSGAGRGGEATRTARRGTRRVRPAVPRTGATAGEASMAPGAPGEAWQDAPARWQAAVRASWETPGTACPPAGALLPPAPAGECAW